MGVSGGTIAAVLAAVTCSSGAIFGEVDISRVLLKRVGRVEKRMGCGRNDSDAVLTASVFFLSECRKENDNIESVQ
jgi:hypothetical protein